MKTILIVDDEIFNREIIKKILIKEGYGVIEAENGKEAIKKYKKYKIDLILMDLMMPTMDGFEAIKIILKNHQIPIIAISALDDNSTYNKVLELGVKKYITKPFNLKKLVQQVKESL